MKILAKLTGAMAVLCFFVFATNCSIGASSGMAVIILDKERETGLFRSELFGSNLQWTDFGDTLFTSNGKIKPQALDALKMLPVGGLRFPGGLLSSTYRWEKGIGDQSSRGNGKDFSGNSQKMVIGTSEYLDLLAKTGRSGMITVNLSQSPEEAGSWVRHIHKVAPGAVPFWEVGNESFLNQDPSFMTAAEYVRRFKNFAAAMKKEDSSIKVGAILEASLVGLIWSKVVVPEVEIWNETVIKGTVGVADYYTVHLYSPFETHNGDDSATLRAVQAGPLALVRNLSKVKEVIRKYAPGRPVLVTEFNIGITDPVLAWKYDISLAQAAYIAQMLAMFSTNGVEGAYHWSLIGNHCFGQIISGDDSRLRPSALLYNLLAPLAKARAVRTEVEADVMPYKKCGNVVTGLSPTIAFAQGYRKGNSLMVVVVNRDPDSSVHVTFRKPDGTALIPVSGKILTGDGPFAQIDTFPNGVWVMDISAGSEKIMPPRGVRVTNSPSILEAPASGEVGGTDIPIGPGVTLPPCGVALVELR